MKNKGIGFNIELPDGRLYFQRYAPVTETEEPLTDQEEAIIFLYSKYERLKLQLEEKRIGDRIQYISDDLVDEGIEYIHKKSGKIYTAFANPVINKTSGESDGVTMVYYRNELGESFVREKSEFDSKFDKI